MIGRFFSRVVPFALAVALGSVVGWVFGTWGQLIPQSINYPFLAERVELPHHVPEHRGGLSFRFAMANDVIHERFASHGPDHSRERIRRTREALARLTPGDPARFPLADDLAAGLERLGRSDEAVAVMREKLGAQEAKGVAGRDLYTTYANLGTFLIHSSFPKARAGDLGARDRFAEGVEFIRRSVEVNPEAHFGRERWQAAIAEFLLAAMDDPALLGRFDCLGNRLDLPIINLLARDMNWVGTSYGRPTDARFSQERAFEEVPAYLRPGIAMDDPALWPELAPIRGHITKVGAEDGWQGVIVPSHRKPVPFDEPMLGIIGMWRQGGGANPHFALAIGETMLRVGQRYIAWAAYERASRLAPGFWPDPAGQKVLTDHCRLRQAEIEATLAYRPTDGSSKVPWQHVSPRDGTVTAATLRAGFDKELALGEGYRRDYREYESGKIAADVPIDDPHFFDGFLAGRDPIASPTGPEELFLWVPRPAAAAYLGESGQAGGIFGAGLAGMAAALFMTWRRRRRKESVPVAPAEVRP